MTELSTSPFRHPILLLLLSLLLAVSACDSGPDRRMVQIETPEGATRALHPLGEILPSLQGVNAEIQVEETKEELTLSITRRGNPKQLPTIWRFAKVEKENTTGLLLRSIATGTLRQDEAEAGLKLEAILKLHCRQKAEAKEASPLCP